MRIRVLGCSGGVGTNLHTTSFLIDEDVLIDAGTGVCTLSVPEIERLRHIFVTHSHLDHITGIPLLIDSVFSRLPVPITVHGSGETLNALQQHIFNWVVWPDFSRLPHPDRPVMRYAEMRPGETRTIGDRAIEMIPVNHVVPAVGYRIQGSEGAFAYSGDTTTNDSLWEALNRHDRLDLLFIEAAFPDKDIDISRRARHYSPQLLAADLAKLRHRPRVCIMHLKPAFEDLTFQECQAQITRLKVERLRGGEVFEV